MDHVDLTLRLTVTVTVAAGVALGLERELNGHPSGVRTHILVAVGAAMFTLTGAYGFADVRTGVNADPARVAAQVASGIGFLGAGSILRAGLAIRGLTTAGTVWLSAACGVAAGAGAFLEVAVGTSLVMVTLVGVQVCRDKFWRRQEGLRLTLQYQLGAGTLEAAVDALQGFGVDIDSIEIRDDTVAGCRRVALDIEVPARLTPALLVATVADAADFTRVELQSAAN